MTPLPPNQPAPPAPSSWNLQAIITYLASLAVFVIGLLTLSGLTIPGSVASDIQLWAGAAVTVVGPLISLVAYLSKNKLTANALQAGVPPEVARRL